MPYVAIDNTIFFQGNTAIEEAEALHDLVRKIATPAFDLSEAGHLHTAVVQIILASTGTVCGMPRDPVLAACFRDRIEP